MSRADDDNIGDRVGTLRRRCGLTQEQLAEAAGVDVSTVRKLEQGARQGARLSTLHALARVLDVSTSDLFEPGTPEPDGDNDDRKVDLMPLRSALTPLPLGLESPKGELDGGIQARLDAAWRLYHENSFALLSADLPEIVSRARASGDTAATTSMLRLAAHLLIQFHETDLAHTALDEGIELANRAGDALGVGVLVGTLCWVLMRQGRLDEARRAAAAMADRIEPRLSRASAYEVATWGWLLLRGSAAAARDNRPNEADDMLSLASAAARRADQGASVPETFGPAVVMMKRAEAAMVTDRPSQVLRLTEGIPVRAHAWPSDIYRHRLDVAAAHVAQRSYTEAFDVLRDVRSDAPEWLARQRYARHTLRTILYARSRPVTDDMREMAGLLRLDG